MTCEGVRRISYDPISVDEQDSRQFLRQIDREFERLNSTLNAVISCMISSGVTDSGSGDSGEFINNGPETFLVGEIIGRNSSGIWRKALPNGIDPFYVVQQTTSPGQPIVGITVGYGKISVDGTGGDGTILYSSTTVKGKATKTRPTGSGSEVWRVAKITGSSKNADGTWNALIYIVPFEDISF